MQLLRQITKETITLPVNTSVENTEFDGFVGNIGGEIKSIEASIFGTKADGSTVENASGELVTLQMKLTGNSDRDMTKGEIPIPAFNRAYARHSAEETFFTVKSAQKLEFNATHNSTVTLYASIRIDIIVVYDIEVSET